MIPGSAAAQQQPSSGPGTGLKVGYVYPEFTTHVFDSENRTGWQAGFFVGGNRFGVIGVQTEFNWLRNKTEFESANGVPAGKVTLDYLQIPVLLRVNIGSRRSYDFDLYGIAGPSFETKLHEEIEGFGGPSNGDFGFNDVNVSLVFGGGVELSRFIIEGRYSKGLRTVNTHFNTNDFKINSFAALLGIRFH
jgi:hypothetical protein